MDVDVDVDVDVDGNPTGILGRREKHVVLREKHVVVVVHVEQAKGAFLLRKLQLEDGR